MGKEGKKGGKEGTEDEKEQLQKKSALETEFLHNTLKHRRELRHQQKTHYVIS